MKLGRKPSAAAEAADAEATAVTAEAGAVAAEAEAEGAAGTGVVIAAETEAIAAIAGNPLRAQSTAANRRLTQSASSRYEEYRVFVSVAFCERVG